jgi:hypothetical protein
MLKSTNFAALNHFKNTGSDISKNQESVQAAFIRALLDISEEEGERLGVAKTIIFEPSAADFSLSSRYGRRRMAPEKLGKLKDVDFVSSSKEFRGGVDDVISRDDNEMAHFCPVWVIFSSPQALVTWLG